MMTITDIQDGSGGGGGVTEEIEKTHKDDNAIHPLHLLTTDFFSSIFTLP